MTPDAGHDQAQSAICNLQSAMGVTRWLVISYYSGVDGLACSQHVDDRIPFLAARGIEATILTSPCCAQRPGLRQVVVPSVTPAGLRMEQRHRLRARFAGRRLALKLAQAACLLPIYPAYFLEKALFAQEDQVAWFLPAMLRGALLCRMLRPELIYSTGGPIGAHLAAARIAKWTGVPWLAEFQDPLVHDGWSQGPRVLENHRRAEARVGRNADAVVLLTECARDRTAARAGLGSRAQTIYPGANPSPSTARYEKGPLCRFAHFGSLGSTRNLAVTLEAMRLLFADRPDLAPVIRLDLYGNVDRYSGRLIGEFPHPEVVVRHGKVSRLECLDRMRQTDVLLLIQDAAPVAEETIPSKCYEYFQAGRPVLALAHRCPELSRMVEQLGHVAVAADDPQDVRRGIERCLELWRSGAAGARQPSPYTVEAAVEQLLEVAGSVAPARSGKDPR